MVFVILLQVAEVGKANFDGFTCVIKICHLLKKFPLQTCNNMTKNVVFTSQEQNITANRRKRDHACAAENHLFSHNLSKKLMLLNAACQYVELQMA